jgi:XTP/dITP diphosphohydrolase
MNLVLATRNEKKGREMARLLGGLGLGSQGLGDSGNVCSGALPRVAVHTLSALKNVPLESDPEETGETFAENALIKARAAARRTEWWALADDSGLAVAWLGGRPGVYSARWAGRHGDDAANNRLLLSQMSGVPPMNRGARFVAAVAVVGPDGREWVVEGECHGVVAYEVRGTGGFGYDSLFLRPELGRTFAELTAEEKDGLSHRGRAFEKARRVLEGLLEVGI